MAEVVDATAIEQYNLGLFSGGGLYAEEVFRLFLIKCPGGSLFSEFYGMFELKMFKTTLYKISLTSALGFCQF